MTLLFRQFLRQTLPRKSKGLREKICVRSGISIFSRVKKLSLAHAFFFHNDAALEKQSAKIGGGRYP